MIKTGAPKRKTNRKAEKKKKIVLIKKNFSLYLMLLIPLIYLFIFKYIPMGGLVIAFQDFNIFKGIAESDWVGFANFAKLISQAEFWNVFRNTLLISIYKLVFLFPIPIIVAIFLNEVKNSLVKRSIQTVIYFPHFLSWVVISGIFFNLLSTSGGLVNDLLAHVGVGPIPFLYDNRFFRAVLVIAEGWKGTGWNAIIYIAGIAGISQDLYEAASIDGASRFKQMWYITLPGLMPTIVMILILNLGHILNAGTEQILTMYNPLVYDSADVIGTYVYRIGLGKMNYSFSTAVGLFNSVVGFILVMSGNYFSRKFNEKSIW